MDGSKHATTRQDVRHFGGTDQPNRIRKVKRPTVETLLALAAALDHHPTPMLVLGRQLTGSSARRQLAELIKAMLSQNDPDDRPGLKELQASLRNADASQLRQVAIEL